MSDILTDYISAAYAVIRNRTEQMTPKEQEQITNITERGGYLSLCLHSGDQPEVRLILLDPNGKQKTLFTLRQKVTEH